MTFKPRSKPAPSLCAECNHAVYHKKEWFVCRRNCVQHSLTDSCMKPEWFTRAEYRPMSSIRQCENCIRKGLRECMYHGYPEEAIPTVCGYKIGDMAINTVYDVPTIIRPSERVSIIQDADGYIEKRPFPQKKAGEKNTSP